MKYLSKKGNLIFASAAGAFLIASTMAAPQVLAHDAAAQRIK